MDNTHHTRAVLRNVVVPNRLPYSLLAGTDKVIEAGIYLPRCMCLLLA
jgi:hypothetical protein